MISGMMNVSKGNEYCYPYIESIKSFLPICDEIVVVVDPYSNDGTEETIRENYDERVRVVSMPFNLAEWGRISWGLQKTCGYQACRGDCVVMFDADGILHEKDIDLAKKKIEEFMSQTQRPVNLWYKYRFYSPYRYYFQDRHYGIFNKKFLGDKLDFFDETKGAMSLRRFTDNPAEMRGMLGVTLWGYEHTFDTKDIYYKKIEEYGKMLDKAQKMERTLEQYVERQTTQARERMDKTNKTADIKDHPIYIQDRLKNLTSEQWGFNYFGLIGEKYARK
jgi:glycosyltransferase involved in cell wall biosynthesis